MAEENKEVIEEITEESVTSEDKIIAQEEGTR